jgi:hypothetical protein
MEQTPNKEQCELCHYFSKYECRYNPPAVIFSVQDGVETHFPIVEKDMWCGKFKNQENEPTLAELVGPGILYRELVKGMKDALDTTRAKFDEFLKDIAELSKDRRIISYEHPIHKEGLDPEKEIEAMKKELSEMPSGIYGSVGQCCMGKPGQEMIEKLRDQLSKAGCEAHKKYFSELIPDETKKILHGLPELKDIDIYGYATEEKIKELREKTGMGKFDCKKALVEAKGDMQEAIEVMRKMGSYHPVKREYTGPKE